MSPRRFIRPGRIAGRIIRHTMRQQRRFIRRRSRRMLLGGAIILALAGSHRAYKMRDDDVRRLEGYYGRPAEELSEEEIVSGMRNLGINKIELDDNDRAKVYQSDNEEENFQVQGQKYCIHCGEMLKYDSNFCSSCGSRI
ncbi:MAG: hypothetical protein ACFFDW_09015 [Candidatus Thorarchaeota archaeon]